MGELDPTGGFRKVAQRVAEQEAAPRLLALPAASKAAAGQKRAKKNAAAEAEPVPAWLKERADRSFREDDNE